MTARPETAVNPAEHEARRGAALTVADITRPVADDDELDGLAPAFWDDGTPAWWPRDRQGFAPGLSPWSSPQVRLDAFLHALSIHGVERAPTTKDERRKVATVLNDIRRWFEDDPLTLLSEL